MADVSYLPRPTTIEEYRERFKGLGTEAGYEDGLRFQPEPTDVIVTPFSKSGTTWLQQIVHGLRTRGDMDFDDISRVVPWLETSYDLGIDLRALQRGFPRAFKSHLSWHEVPKNGRYIVSVRNPKDVLVSMYRFMEGWFFEPGTISITDFANDSFLQPKEDSGYWHHLLSWWPQRQREDVLLLAYEGMRADLPGTVRRVAEFIGVTLDDELFELVVRQSSFDFMLAHKDRFDDRLMRERSERIAKLPSDSDSSKVRAGQVGSHVVELTPEIRQRLDEIWQEKITPVLGFANYKALLAAL
jgi:hypothetical protein